MNAALGRLARKTIVLASVALGYLQLGAGAASAAPLGLQEIRKDAAILSFKPSVAPLAVAYDCLGAMALHAQKVDGSLSRARRAADALIASVSTDDSGRKGWTYGRFDTPATRKCNQPGAIDSFGDGTCNAPNTPYMIQTGYAVACLAQVGIATGDARYVEAAKKAVDDSWDLGAAPSNCANCFQYFPNYSPNDRNRYVRNVSAVMGMGVAWLYGATKDERYRERALAVARSEHREISLRNFGYFGSDDPRYRANPSMEADRIENHVPHQVKALKDIGTLLASPQASDDAKVLLDSFLNCRNGRCRPGNCAAWAAPASCKATATIAPCILAERGEPYRSRCEEALRGMPRLSAYQVFLRHAPKDVQGLK